MFIPLFNKISSLVDLYVFPTCPFGLNDWSWDAEMFPTWLLHLNVKLYDISYKSIQQKCGLYM